MDNNEKLQKQIDELKKDLQALNDEYYRNNFTTFQEFTKFSSFTSRLKVPHYDALPNSCEIGEIIESSGNLMVCSAKNTWTVVGTQT